MGTLPLGIAAMGRSGGLQVVEAGERTTGLRVVASAADSGNAGNPRAARSTKILIAWLQGHPLRALPRVRTTLEGGTAVGET